MKGRILIVDDDSDTVEMLRLVLSESGYITRAAATGAEALTKARRTPPDLVLLDLILPDQNGLYVCTALRRDEATASIPIIMMTAMPGEFPRFAGIEAGADVYLNKPFSTDRLIALIGDLLQGKQPRPAVFESGQALTVGVGLSHAAWKEPPRSVRQTVVLSLVVRSRQADAQTTARQAADEVRASCNSALRSNPTNLLLANRLLVLV